MKQGRDMLCFFGYTELNWKLTFDLIMKLKLLEYMPMLRNAIALIETIPKTLHQKIIIF